MPDPAMSQVVVDVVLAVIIGILGFYQWLSKKSQINAEQIKNLERDLRGVLETQARQLAQIEARLDHAPGRSDLKRIHRRLDDMTKCVSRMEGELHSHKGTLSMIHEYLMNREKS